MSVSSEVERLEGARDTIRTKLVALGLATDTDTLDALATSIDGITNRGAVSKTLSTSSTSYTVPKGYHNGSGKVKITTETKTATPSTASQSIAPTSGRVLSKVTVNAIPAQYKDVSGTDALAVHVLKDRTFVSEDSESRTGTMPDNGAVSHSLAANGTYTIPEGYHNGEGTVTQSLTNRTSSSLTASGATVSVPAGYYAAAASKSVATATQATPSISIDSAGLITASATQTAGYVSAGTKSATKQITVKAATTYSPKTTAQTIAAGTYLTGAQTIAATTGTAAVGNVLKGKTFNSANGIGLTGTMVNNGAVTSSLNAGGSYTIPAGYHNGSGKVTANSLSSQTAGTATAADVIEGKTAWVAGSQVTGTLPLISYGTEADGSIYTMADDVVEGTYLAYKIPTGAYTAATPYIRATKADVAATIGLTAGKILKGNTILGIAGTADTAATSTAATFKMDYAGGYSYKAATACAAYGSATKSSTTGYVTLPAGTYRVVGFGDCDFTGTNGFWIAKQGAVSTALVSGAAINSSYPQQFYIDTTLTLTASTTITLVMYSATAGYGRRGAASVFRVS